MWKDCLHLLYPPGDLNPHDQSHWNLNPARLPIPPSGHKEAEAPCIIRQLRRRQHRCQRNPNRNRSRQPRSP